MGVPKKRSEEPRVDSDTVIELVTPELAYDYLKTAFAEALRPLRKNTVHRYAKLMKEGKWKLTHQGIGFDTEGRLRDGQHRLWAVVEANTPVPMRVTRNAPAETFDLVDQGQRRTPADVVAIHGYSQSTVLSSASAWEFLYEKGRLGLVTNTRYSTISPEDRLAILENTLIEEALCALSILPKGYKQIIPPGLLVWLYYKFESVDPDYCKEFFRILRDGALIEGVTANNPVLKLRERLMLAVVGGKSHSMSNQVERAALAIKAWNLFVSGQERAFLMWRPGEEFPKVMVADAYRKSHSARNVSYRSRKKGADSKSTD